MGSAITHAALGGLPSPTGASLELALHAAHAGVWEWDLRTNENRWTEEVWRLYGLTPGSEPPSFDAWLASIHPDDRAPAVQVVSDASRAGAPFEACWRTNPDRGPVRWILSRGQPGLPTRDGPTQYVGIVMDITSQRATEEEVRLLRARLVDDAAHRAHDPSERQRLLQTILDGVPGLVGYWDHALRNRFANHAYGDWFGMTPEQIHGRHISELLGPSLFELNRPHIEGALRGERQCFLRDLPMPDQPGRLRVTETHYLPDVEGSVVKGFLVLVLDVTHTKRAEQSARAASQAKSDFLSNVSHELRTPLNTMFGLAQIGLKEGNGTPCAGTFRQILESGQHLLSLIDEVLDFSKIEAGKMHLHLGVVDLGQLVEQVLGVTALRACSKGIRLVIDESVDVPAQTLGDAKRLTQILVNLLTNAIKFTDEGEVRLGLSRQGGLLHLTVSDTGMGIPPERLGDLFQPFVQVHDSQTALAAGQGTGLGLAICKRLVELMGGQIEVLSERGRGTSFRVSLLLKEAAPPRWAPLSDCLLIGFPEAERDNLLNQLRERGCPACWNDASPDTRPRGTTLMLHQRALSTLSSDQLNELQAGDLPLIVHLPDVSMRPVCRDGAPLPMDTLVLSGPLSPLRLLHALNHRPRTPGRTCQRRLSGLRLLAAEDNPVNRLILGQMLEAEGATIEFAFDGAQAVERIQRGPRNIDLVLCDIQMPVMDGNEATRRILQLAPDLPVIGLTAHAFTQAREEALRAGMVDYITKPYMLDTLVQAVLKHVSHLSGSPMNVVPPSTPAPSPGQPSPLADWACMQQHFAPQPSVMSALVGVARQTLPGVAGQLDQSLQTQDLPRLAKVAHEVKGIALNLRAPGLTELATRTQDQSRQADPEALETGLRLSEHLKGFLAQMNNAPAGIGAPDTPRS